jgi:hypothetical protein
MSFLTHFQQAFQNGQLLKCTLAKPTVAAPEGLKNIYIRPVSLKKGLYLAFNYRYKTRDEVKNFLLTEAVEQLEKILGSQFLMEFIIVSLTLSIKEGSLGSNMNFFSGVPKLGSITRSPGSVRRRTKRSDFI